ncbi:hypothetical protein N0X72_25405 [Streptomyces carpaticus]|uniref:hypothetical protein n=1 Tax=Streptomyces carpaticus TaxID=285558 RepID=UPI00220E598F|nr:hypothetical protein N0X72_25405 [Streptomyces carpaticus]
MATVTIPGALADHLADEVAGDLDTITTLAEGRRGRGRTLVITPRSTTALHTISRVAEQVLDAKGAPRALRDAARLWIKRAGRAPKIVVHRFADSYEAYDAAMSCATIHDGDVLVVESEEIVAVLVGAWPAAITTAHGELHTITEDPRTLDGGKYAASATRAEQIAAELDSPLAMFEAEREITLTEGPFPGAALLVRADAVLDNDIVLGAMSEGVTVTTATADDALLHAAPYLAAPTPHLPCGCTGCEQYTTDHTGHPGITLAHAHTTPWDACDVVPIDAPVVIRRPVPLPDRGPATDWWTITAADGAEIARVEGATADDMIRAAEALPAVQATIRAEGGFTRRRLAADELT